jgi:hypothetical protein
MLRSARPGRSIGIARLGIQRGIALDTTEDIDAQADQTYSIIAVDRFKKFQRISSARQLPRLGAAQA